MKLLAKIQVENGAITKSKNVISFNFLNNNEMRVNLSDTLDNINGGVASLSYYSRIQANSNVSNSGPNNMNPRTDNLSILGDYYNIICINGEFSARNGDNDIFVESFIFSDEPGENIDDFLLYSLHDQNVVNKSSIFGNVTSDTTDPVNGIPVVINLNKPLGDKIPMVKFVGPIWDAYVHTMTCYEDRIELLLIGSTGSDIVSSPETRNLHISVNLF